MKTRSSKFRKSRKRSNLRKNRKIGGDYVYQGTYGCTFANPALPCKGENGVRRPGMLTKLMMKIDAQDEIKQKDLLSPIDPDQLYFLYPLDTCEPDTSLISSQTNQYTKCTSIKNIKESPENTLQLLFYNNGGDNLQVMNVDQSDYEQFFKSFLNLFEGISLLHDNNIAHLDIKPANIVSLQNNDGSFSTKLIDFGLTTRTDVFGTSLQPKVYSGLYEYWPIELYLIQSVRYSSYETIFNRLKNQRDRLHNYTNTTYGEFLGWPLKFNLKNDTFKKLIHNIYKNEETIYKPSNIAKSVDVYGLGLALGEVYGRLTGHILWGERFNTENLIIRDSKSLKQENKMFDDELIKNTVSKPFLYLIYDMIHPVYNKRITIHQAKERFRSIMPLFNNFRSISVNNSTPSSISMNINNETFVSGPISLEAAAAVEAAAPAAAVEAAAPKIPSVSKLKRTRGVRNLTNILKENSVPKIKRTRGMRNLINLLNKSSSKKRKTRKTRKTENSFLAMFQIV